MNKPKKILISSIIFFSPLICFSQSKIKIAKSEDVIVLHSLKSSPAYAEIVLRKTELRAEIEALLIAYTEEFPKIQDGRYELGVLDRELTRLLSVRDGGRYTMALGKLIVKKAEVEADYAALQKKYGDDHPDVKRAKRKVEIYETAIKDLIG